MMRRTMSEIMVRRRSLAPERRGLSQARQGSFVMKRSIGIAALCAAAIGAAAGAAQQHTGDVAQGRELFAVCAPCHEIGRGAQHKTGPSLNGLFGRRAGQIDGYASSLPMTLAGMRGLVWTDETLDRYLQDPESVVRESDMPFIGLDDAAERAALRAYLRAASQAVE